MSASALDAWLTANRMIRTRGGPDDSMAFTDMELTLFVCRRAGRFVIELSSRGSTRAPLASFETEPEALRYLLTTYGTVARTTTYYLEFAMREGTRTPAALLRRQVTGGYVEDGIYCRDGSWASTERVALWLNGSGQGDIEQVTQRRAADFIAAVLSGTEVTSRRRSSR